MTQKAANLKALGQIAEMVLEARLAELAGISRTERQLCDQIRGLDEQSRSILPDSPEVTDLANAASWMRLRQDRKSRLNTQLAALKADKEVILQDARRALGRVQAISSLESLAK